MLFKTSYFLARGPTGAKTQLARECLTSMYVCGGGWSKEGFLLNSKLAFMSIFMLGLNFYDLLSFQTQFQNL